MQRIVWGAWLLPMIVFTSLVLIGGEFAPITSVSTVSNQEQQDGGSSQDELADRSIHFFQKSKLAPTVYNGNSPFRFKDARLGGPKSNCVILLPWSLGFPDIEWIAVCSIISGTHNLLSKKLI